MLKKISQKKSNDCQGSKKYKNLCRACGEVAEYGLNDK